MAPEPTPPVPREAPALLLGRHEFLKGLGAVLVALASPFTRLRQAYVAARGRFFTAHEFATLEALCDRILPADGDPGARELGAATYIEALLTAFDRPVPLIFAGGPFSNRNPFPDNVTGTPSSKRLYGAPERLRDPGRGRRRVAGPRSDGAGYVNLDG